MPITAFLAKVNVSLVSKKHFMTTITDTYGRGINLITVSNAYSVEHTANHQRN